MMQIEVVRTDIPIRYTDAANEQNHDDCDARKRERHRSSLPRPHHAPSPRPYG
jgi:hypothetical protein